MTQFQVAIYAKLQHSKGEYHNSAELTFMIQLSQLSQLLLYFILSPTHDPVNSLSYSLSLFLSLYLSVSLSSFLTVRVEL